MSAHDVVIVGAGSAGCVLAARLSEDPSLSVLLLEAGAKDRSPNIKIPAAFPKQFRTKLDWDYSSGPEPHLDGRELYVPRGKSVGGSGSMNAMMWVRGRPVDFDAWEAQGADGWGWAQMQGAFERAERDAVGPSDLRSPSPLTQRFVDAAQEAGVPHNPNINAPEQDGVGPTPVSQKNGRRWSTADGYLRPALDRPNLTIKTGVTVTGIEITGGRATGVKLLDRRGRPAVARATREVVLCAGAIGSPQLLLLSGVGPAAQLRDHGIAVVHDLPGVGENLQDHPFFTLCWEDTAGESLYGAEDPQALLRWVLKRDGKLSSNVGEAMGFVRTRAGLPAADLQLIFGSAYYHDHGFDSLDGHAFTIGPVLLTPKARGHVRLRSADPAAKPLIVGNHLSEPEDMATLVAGFKLARRIAASPALAKVAGRELVPGPGVDSDEDIEAFVRRET